MARKNKKEFPLTPELKKFQYEVASELGITGIGNIPFTKEENGKQPRQ